MNDRCLYNATLHEFIHAYASSVYTSIRSAYHGGAYDTTDEAWLGEIDILQRVLLPWKKEDAHIIFEYDLKSIGIEEI